MSLVELAQHDVAQRFDRRHDERAAGGGEFVQRGAVAQEVRDLRREVVRHAREHGVQRAHQPERMGGPVEKIGVAERDVARAAGDEASDVLEHDVLRDDKEAAVVDGRNGAVQAMVETAAARFDVASQDLGAVLTKSGVAGERWEGVAIRHWKTLFACGVRRVACGVRRAGVVDQRLFEFPAEHGVGDAVEQVVGVQHGVEAEEGDAAVRIALADAARGAHAEAQRRVHGDGDRDDGGAADLRVVPGLDREVQGVGGESRAGEEGSGPGEAERLVAELVAGDEEYGAGVCHRVNVNRSSQLCRTPP